MVSQSSSTIAKGVIDLLKKEAAQKDAKIREQSKNIALLTWNLRELEESWQKLSNENEAMKEANIILQQKFMDQQDEITRAAGSMKTLAEFNKEQEEEARYWQLHAEETDKKLKAEEVASRKMIRKMVKSGSKDRKAPTITMDKAVQTESAIYFYKNLKNTTISG